MPCGKGTLSRFNACLRLPGDSEGKASVRNEGDPGSIPGSADPLEKEMATHSSILSWRIPWTEEPSRLQSTGSQTVGHVPFREGETTPVMTHRMDWRGQSRSRVRRQAAAIVQEREGSGPNYQDDIGVERSGENWEKFTKRRL